MIDSGSARRYESNDMCFLSQPPGRELKCERGLTSKNGFQIWIADDVSIRKITSEKFLVPTPPAES